MSELKRCEVCGEQKEMWLVLYNGDKRISCLCKCEEDEFDKTIKDGVFVKEADLR